MAYTKPPSNQYGGNERMFKEAVHTGRLDQIAHQVRWALEGTFAEPGCVKETPERVTVSAREVPRRGPEAAIEAQSPLQAMTAELLRSLEAQGLAHHVEPVLDKDTPCTMSLDIYPDLTREGALLLRVGPFVQGSRVHEPRTAATTVQAPSRALSTTEAAELLNVSRPYVASLCDAGVFKGVTKTQGGHRRIPEPEVLRVRLDMHATRRKALDDMLDLTQPAMEAEADRAHASARGKGRRWVAVGSEKKKPS